MANHMMIKIAMEGKKPEAAVETAPIAEEEVTQEKEVTEENKDSGTEPTEEV